MAFQAIKKSACRCRADTSSDAFAGAATSLGNAERDQTIQGYYIRTVENCKQFSVCIEYKEENRDESKKYM